MTRVLLISKDPVLEQEVAQLPLQNSRVEVVLSLDAAEELLAVETFPLCLLDQRMEGGKNAQRIEALRAVSPSTQVIVLLFDSESPALAPAWDGRKTISAGFDTLVHQALEQGRLTRDSQFCSVREAREQRLSTDIPGDSEGARNLRDRIRKIAVSTASVLIEAEPGVDAELVARALHGESRVQGHFVSVACAGPRRGELAALLLGTQNPAQPGAIELADGGTLFLDDVQVLSPPVQDILVRVIEEGEMRRQGSQRAIPASCRWISRSTLDLKGEVKVGSFREDLYWKLCGAPCALVPLRRRRDDIESLFKVAVRNSAARFSRKEPSIAEAVLAAIRAYDFPGNDSELRQLAEVLVIQSDQEIGLAALPVRVLLERRTGPLGEPEPIPIKQAVHEFERQIILETLKLVGGNQSKAARRLNIHRNTLILKMQELGIPNKRQASRG